MQQVVSRLRDDGDAISAAVLFAVGALADTITTHVIVATPGLVEANPFVNYVLEHGGPLGILGFKLVMFGLLIGVILYAYPPKHYRRALVISGLTCGGLWLAAALWNIHLLFV